MPSSAWPGIYNAMGILVLPTQCVLHNCLLVILGVTIRHDPKNSRKIPEAFRDLMRLRRL